MTRIEHPEEVLQVGQECEVVVHNFDYRSRKIALHPAPPPEQADEPRQKVTRGATVKAEVIRGEGPGVVVRLLGVTGRAARGFIPAGQTGTSRGTDLRKHFRPGSVIEAKIVDVDPRRGEPKLSIRGLKDDEERRAHKEYRHTGRLHDPLGYAAVRPALDAAVAMGSHDDLVDACLPGIVQDHVCRRPAPHNVASMQSGVPEFLNQRSQILAGLCL